MKNIRHHLICESRRLTFAGTLAFVSGCLLYAHIDAVVFGMPFSVFAGVIYFVFVILAAAVTTYLLPSLRMLIEGVALSRLCLALFVAVSPAGQQAVLLSPLVNATTVVMGAIGLVWLFRRLENLGSDKAAPPVVLTVAGHLREAADWVDNSEVRSAPQPISVHMARARA